MDQKKTELANKILAYSCDRLVAALPLMSHALLRMPYDLQPELPDGAVQRCGTDGKKIFWEASNVLRLFKNHAEQIPHSFLHMVLHCVYTHMYAYEKMEADFCFFVCDIAVENVIDQLPAISKPEKLKNRQETVIEILRPYVPDMTAEQIYRTLQQEEELQELVRMNADAFHMDEHCFWKKPQYEELDSDLTIYARPAEFFEDKRAWEQIFQTISLLKEQRSLYEGHLSGSQNVYLGNLSPALRSYARILNRFAVLEEETDLDPDAFDMIFYTYGLSLYGNLPLIEPLEYRESNKIREIVIAIDTSGSCQGEKVREFLRNTCTILTEKQSFFDRFLVYIIQCDSKVQHVDEIRSKEEFERYMCDVEIHGAGGTDFRPVFEHVETQIEAGTFHSLQGLIYFTDGLGQYPEEAPAYKTLFIYPDTKERYYETPAWAETYILDEHR